MAGAVVGEWGLYDTKDDCWIGNDEGPVTYPETDAMGLDKDGVPLVARIAAQVVDVRLQQRPGRTRARRYEVPATKLKDEQATVMDNETAIRKIEQGHL